MYFEFIPFICILGLQSGSQDVGYRLSQNTLLHVTKEPLPPRHRRKRRDDELTTNNLQSPQPARESVSSRGAQFDLEDSAFPPLPGIFLNYKIKPSKIRYK